MNLWHICTRHPFASSGPCTVACTGYCGAPINTTTPDEPTNLLGITSDCCVVCIELAYAADPRREAA